MGVRARTELGPSPGPDHKTTAQGWQGLWRRDDPRGSVSRGNGSGDDRHVPQGPDAYWTEPASGRTSWGSRGDGAFWVLEGAWTGVGPAENGDPSKIIATLD